MAARTTRSRAGNLPQEDPPASSENRPKRARKAASVETTSAPSTSATAAPSPPHRRLRSTKVPTSPLHSLPEPEKKKKVTKKQQHALPALPANWEAEQVKKRDEDIRAQAKAEAAEEHAGVFFELDHTLRKLGYKEPPRPLEEATGEALLRKVKNAKIEVALNSARIQAEQRGSVWSRKSDLPPEVLQQLEQEQEKRDQPSSPAQGPHTPTAVAPAAPVSSHTPSTPATAPGGVNKIKQIFNWFTSLVTPGPAQRLTQAEAEEFKQSLTPSAPEIQSPSTQRSKKPATRRPKNKNRHGHSSDRIIVKRVLQKVDRDEQELAKVWVKDALKKIDDGSATAGDKRKRLEKGLKAKDFVEIPARKPWQSSGTFALQDEFFDYSSDEEVEVPEYYVLDALAANKPLKKRKTEHNSDMDVDVQSLNDISTIDSHGNSSSLLDLHPRPSHLPSPMFGSPDSFQGGNVFQQSTSSEDAAKRADQLRRTGHIEGTSTWAVPEGNTESDVSDSTITEDSQTAPVWTQSPPPAPTPAHATLPAPVAAAEATSETDHQDPVSIQRAIYTKHTPAKPSKLRQAIVPSPSVFSDPATSDDVFGPASVPLGDDGMPDAVPIDLGDPILNASIEDYYAQPAIQAKAAFAWGGSDINLVYESEEEVSE